VRTILLNKKSISETLGRLRRGRHRFISVCGVLILLLRCFAGFVAHAQDSGPAGAKDGPPLLEAIDGALDETAEEPKPASATPAKPLLDSPVLPVETKSESFHWRPALEETLLFSSIMHAKRLGDPDTGPELKGPWFKDYFRSVAGLHGWDDYDPFVVQYIGHSFHGASDSRIELQNNPNGRAIDWGMPGYWHSRAVAMAWSALWGTQFKIGPYSEAMIGNVGLPNQYRKHPLPDQCDYGTMAWSEFFVNPVGGTAWVMSEDLLDRYVVRRMEGKANRYFMYVARSFLTPSRAWANLMRFKVPWYRETRSIDGRPLAFH